MCCIHYKGTCSLLRTSSIISHHQTTNDPACFFFFCLLWVFFLSNHDCNVHPLPMFLPCPGGPVLTFQMQMCMFNSYLLVINTTGRPGTKHSTRRPILLTTQEQRDRDSSCSVSFTLHAEEKYIQSSTCKVISCCKIILDLFQMCIRHQANFPQCPAAKLLVN